MQSNQQRERSSSDHGLAQDGKLSVEDIQVMKLMEEIMEFDQEIKMKQKWINTRVKMLHKILPNQKPRTGELVEQFIKQLQPEYPEKLTVTYENPAI